MQSVRIANRKQLETIEIADTNVNNQSSHLPDERESPKGEAAKVLEKTGLEPILESYTSLPTIEEAQLADSYPHLLAENQPSLYTSS